MRLRYSELAVSDITQVYDYISRDNPVRAEATVVRVDAAITGLVQFPRRGRPGRVNGTRELVVSGTPYVVPYCLTGDEIEILAIVDGRRAWPSSF